MFGAKKEREDSLKEKIWAERRQEWTQIIAAMRKVDQLVN